MHFSPWFPEAGSANSIWYRGTGLEPAWLELRTGDARTIWRGVSPTRWTPPSFTNVERWVDAGTDPWGHNQAVLVYHTLVTDPASGRQTEVIDRIPQPR